MTVTNFNNINNTIKFKIFQFDYLLHFLFAIKFTKEKNWQTNNIFFAILINFERYKVIFTILLCIALYIYSIQVKLS